MQINQLLDVKSELEVSGLSHLSDRVRAGDLFFCLADDSERRQSAAIEAEQRGAVAIVTSHIISGTKLHQFIVSDARRAMAVSAHRFFGKPADKLTIIGVTGTNGKTTTSYVIKSILEAAGHKVGLIGTNEAIVGDKHLPATLTTPDPTDLHALLAEMAECGADSVVMEVSAHALALRKLDGFKFSVAAFTNLTPDHLDFFKNMETYKQAKEQLFTPEHSLAAVINVDDKTGLEIFRKCELPIVTYGCDNPSDVFAIDYSSSLSGCKFVANVMDGIINVDYCGAGRFNMYNVLCACAVTSALGVPPAAMERGISALKKVEGRVNIIQGNGKNVVVDYAHTPDGLKNIIATVREFTRGKVITVFGCGGDRDRTKRAVMGEIAGDMSDFTIITSDNPRSEHPQSIIDEIASGIKRNNYEMIADREKAIERAVEMCGTDDTVIVAGKGHENTQEIGGVKHRFIDTEIVERLLR